jgi:transcription termination/antitermination protein NusA
MAKAKLVPVVSVEDKRKTRSKDLLKLVDLIQEEKKISREVVFSGIEAAIRLAAERHFAVEEGVYVHIDRATGDITARYGENEVDPETLGRIAAQSAKQVMIQKVREAESDTVYGEYHTKKGEMIVGTITRIDAGTAIVSLGKTEALLPRSEQIPGETHHLGERVKAVVFEVRKAGQRVKIVLSRAHPDFVKALFQEEIPEVDDRTIDIRNVAREPGYRSKVAVSSIDSKVDCVGACVGVRGSRIKNIIEELNGERIDIVRYNDSKQILIPNALSPAEISDVFTYPRLGRAIVLVNDDQLSLAIGRRGQNVRLASKLVGMDLEIMTPDELGEALERAERWFRQLPNVTEAQVQAIVEEGFLSYNELTYIDAEELLKFAPEMTEEVAVEIIDYAEEYADHMDRATEDERAESQRAAAELRAAAEAQAEIDEAASANPAPEVVSETATETPIEETLSSPETPSETGETMASETAEKTPDGATA